MALTITDTKQVGGKDYQIISVQVAADGDNCVFTHSVPKDLEGDDLQSYVDGREDWYKRELLRNMYEGADCYNSSLEDWEKWIAAGCKNAEITETIETPAVPAADAVMGTRPKMTEVDEEVSKTVIEEVDGKMVQREVKETVTKQVPVTKEVPLFNEAGEEIGTHTVEETEEYEVTPAVEAVEESSETVVVRAETVVDKVAWKDTAE